jgi:hypothetical protein
MFYYVYYRNQTCLSPIKKFLFPVGNVTSSSLNGSRGPTDLEKTLALASPPQSTVAALHVHLILLLGDHRQYRAQTLVLDDCGLDDAHFEAATALARGL